MCTARTRSLTVLSRCRISWTIFYFLFFSNKAWNTIAEIVTLRTHYVLQHWPGLSCVEAINQCLQQLPVVQQRMSSLLFLI